MTPATRAAASGRRSRVHPRPGRLSAVSSSYLIAAVKAVGAADVALLLVDERPFAAACRDERERTRDPVRRAGFDQLTASDAASVRAALCGLGVVVFPRRAYSSR